MTHRIFNFILAAISCILILVMSNGKALAQNTNIIHYTCSNQIYQALDKQKIKAFTKVEGIRVSVSTLSSNAAVSQLLCGRSELASTTRHLYPRDIEQGLRQIPICKDPLAIIVRKGCGVNNLTEKQVQDIFSGIIINWKELGGKDLKITVIIPGKETAANKNFRRYFMKHKDIKYDIMTWDSTMAVTTVENFPCGTISFIGQGSVAKDPNIRTIKIDGKLPEDPDYPYYQIFYYVIRGKAPNEAVKKFIAHTFSEAGRKLIQENGMIPRPCSEN